MKRWRGVWTLGVGLTLGGCSASPPPSPPEAPAGDERVVIAPDSGGPGPSEGSVDGGSVPSETPDASTLADAGHAPPDAGHPAPTDGGSLSGLEGEMTLAPRACIAWTHDAPPVRATACASSSVFVDGMRQQARYDTDSHLLELRTTTATGAPSTVETHAWRDGLERLRRMEYATGAFEQTEWTYGAGQRLLRWVRTSSSASDAATVDFTYDAQGLLTQVLSQYSSLSFTSDYTYDAAGRLVSIHSEDRCGSRENRCATLSYWPNGRLKRHAWQEGTFNSYTEDYDELGQLALSTSSFSEGAGSNSRAYDAQGREIRSRQSFHSTSSRFEALITTVFDPSSQRERRAADRTNYFSCDHDDACAVTHERATRRTTFFCGTQIVALDEWDSDEDGVVDAQRTHERDATGRLVHEEYSGTPGLDAEPVRRDFRYDCP